MIEATGTAQHAAWQARELPPVEQVRPGLWSIPVPLPNTALRYVLVYALELPDGVAIVDAGWETPDAWAALTAGLAVGGFTVADVRAILITHVHPDHYGLAGRVRAESGGWIGLHRLEAESLPGRYGAVDAMIERGQAWLRRAGAPEEEAGVLAGSSRDMLPLVRMAEPDRLVEDGELIGLPGWQVRAVWTPGHTPGHLCFHEERTGVLLSGDHVLPRISPNVSAHPLQQPDPLREFLDSLAKVGKLDVGEVLPAHEYRFSGLADRVADLLEHHEERLAELRARIVTEPGASTWELAERMPWRRPWSEITGFNRRAAVGETLAHLRLLVSRGLVRSSAGSPGTAEADETDRWTAIRPGEPISAGGRAPRDPME
jgi:glyoxylase-like metal-dependent hydrolase (beta-lactamase superfamily II)